MNVCMMLGKNAGLIGFLTVRSMGYNIEAVVGYDDVIKKLCDVFNVCFFSSIRDSKFKKIVSKTDMLISVHGREIVPEKILNSIMCINVHPCLYKYKGGDPIGRLLEMGDTKASVGCHIMTEKIDSGKVLEEIFIDVGDCDSVIEIYNKLYPYYSFVLRRVLQMLVSKTKTNR